MKSMKKRIRLILCALCILSCTSCSVGKTQKAASEEAGIQKESKQYKIGISFPTTELIFRETMKGIVEKTYPAGNTDQRAQVVIYDGESSQKKQNQDIMDMIAAGVDGIVIVPYTMEGPLSIVEYANEKGIPVITVDNCLESSTSAKFVSFVGADHYFMGMQASELLLSALEDKFPEKEKWNVIQLTGVPNSSGAVDRGEAIEEVIGRTPRIQLLGSYNAEFKSVNAKSIVLDCLQVHDDIQGIICQNDLMAEGCYEALKEAGKDGDIVVIGIDGQKSVVEKMVTGGIHGTVLQSPSMINVGVERLCDYLDGEEIEAVYYQKTDKIYPEDAQEFLDKNLPW